MRYDPRGRIKFPHVEDGKLWRALDTIGIPYDKIPDTRPRGADRRINYYAAAKVWYTDLDYGLIDFKEARRMGQRASNGLNVRSIQARELKLMTWKKMNVPVLLISRWVSGQGMEVIIKRWISELKGE